MAEFSDDKIDSSYNSESENNYDIIKNNRKIKETLYEISDKYEFIQEIKKEIDKLSDIQRRHESDIHTLMDILPKDIRDELLLNPSLMDNPQYFIKRVKMTKQLATFLGKDVNAYITPDEANDLVRKYIIQNGLQDKEKFMKINPDEKITALFGLTGDSGVLSFLNIGNYINEHLT